MNNPRCDVCGSEATTFCQDVQEGEPVADSAGKLWRTFVPENPRWRCDGHWDPPKKWTSGGGRQIVIHGSDEHKALYANDRMAPRRFKFPVVAGTHPAYHPVPYQYGCYFPMTDLVVTDMGDRWTGCPRWEGVEWLDEERK